MGMGFSKERCTLDDDHGLHKHYTMEDSDEHKVRPFSREHREPTDDSGSMFFQSWND